MTATRIASPTSPANAGDFDSLKQCHCKRALRGNPLFDREIASSLRTFLAMKKLQMEKTCYARLY